MPGAKQRELGLRRAVFQRRIVVRLPPERIRGQKDFLK